MLSRVFKHFNDAQALKGASTIECECAYASEPSTPYIAYLRQDSGKTVTSHLIYQLGVSDKLRVSAVPFQKDASWRDCSGPTSTMHHPKMMELTKEEWEEVSPRYVTWIPGYMLGPSGKKGLSRGQLPELLNGWKLEERRFPVVPYWCVSSKIYYLHCYALTIQTSPPCLL